MNSAEHKAEAERLIAWVEFGHYQMWSDVVKNQLLRAQVHATLANVPDDKPAESSHDRYRPR